MDSSPFLSSMEEEDHERRRRRSAAAAAVLASTPQAARSPQRIQSPSQFQQPPSSSSSSLLPSNTPTSSSSTYGDDESEGVLKRRMTSSYTEDSHARTITSASASSSTTTTTAVMSTNPSSLHASVSSSTLCSPTNSLFGRKLYGTFPDYASRLLFFIFVFIFIGLGLWWLYLTINNKWIESQRNPSISVYTSSLDTLPLIRGLLSFFHWDMNILNYTSPLATAAPYRWVEVNLGFDLLSNATYQCNYYDPDVGRPLFHPMRITLTQCMPAVPDMHEARDPVTHQLDPFQQTAAWSALQDHWPIGTNSTLRTLCFTWYLLLNEQQMYEFYIFDPSHKEASYRFNLSHTAPFEFVAVSDVTNMIRLGQDVNYKNSPSFYSRPIRLEYGISHEVRNRVSQTKKLDGSLEWHTEFTYGGGLQMNAAFERELWDDFMARRPDLAAQIAADPNIHLPDANHTQPNATKIHVLKVCFGADSFDIIVTEEKATYGFFAFASDLGGVLSLVSLIYIFLFPLATSFIQARTFLFFWLGQRAREHCKCCSKHGEAVAGGGQETELDAVEPHTGRFLSVSALSSSAALSSSPADPEVTPFLPPLGADVSRAAAVHMQTQHLLSSHAQQTQATVAAQSLKEDSDIFPGAYSQT